MLSVMKEGLLCPRYGVFSDPEMMRRLIFMYQSKKSLVEIAKELDVSYYLCQLIMNNYGMRNISYVKYNVVTVCELRHNEPKSDYTKKKPSVVSSKRKSVFADNEKLSILIKEYNAGKTYKQLAEIFGVSSQTCYVALKKANAINKRNKK